MTTDYKTVHYFATQNGDAIAVMDCATARYAASAGGWADGAWWIEVHHYDEAGEPVAGGEWPCGCEEVA